MVEDFNYTSLHQDIDPAVIILPFSNQEYMYVRFASNDLISNIGIIEDTWREITNDAPLEWRFLDDDIDQLYHSEEKLSSMKQIFAVLAISLACLGLYGLVTFMINYRIKEVGVRKVLGASLGSLYALFIRKYLYQIFAAMFLIILATDYLLMDWLDGFAYHIQINWLIYPISTLLLIAMI